MPEISRFYGLKITMHYISSEHHKPHIHVNYGKRNGSISIEDGTMIIGDLSNQTISLVKTWIELHKDELLKMWSTQTFTKIKGLE